MGLAVRGECIDIALPQADHGFVRPQHGAPAPHVGELGFAVGGSDAVQPIRFVATDEGAQCQRLLPFFFGVLRGHGG